MLIDQETVSRIPLNVQADGDFTGFTYHARLITPVVKALAELNRSGVATLKLTDRGPLMVEMPFKLGSITYIAAGIVDMKAFINGVEVKLQGVK